MTKRTRHSEIRVTGADGVTHIGTGDGMALAARDLGERHAAEQTCRHCGQPVELGIDGALLRARLGLDDEYPVPYVAHLRCQVAVLDQLAAESHEAISQWRLTPAGAALIATGGSER
jgi:hypothetical protein